MLKQWRGLKRVAGQLVRLNRDYLTELVRERNVAHLDNPAKLPEEIADHAVCCFTLSTGRCGTELLARLFSVCDNVMSRHHAFPELGFSSKMAYELAVTDEHARLIAHMARFEHIRQAYLASLIYAETNNRLTFFAPAIGAAFAGAKFVHLVRSPLPFIKSGLNRSYYSGAAGDESRIVPRTNDPCYGRWNSLSPAQKIAWLWNATNSYVEAFKEVADGRVIMTRSEDLFSDPGEFSRICRFVGIHEPAENTIRLRINRPVNVGRPSSTAVVEDGHLRDAIAEFAPLAAKYGYET